MKRKFFEAHKTMFKKLSCLALAAMMAGTGFVAYRNTTVSDIPELVTFVDPEISTVEEDEVPLAVNKKTTKKVTTKTTTEKMKMAKKAKKTKTTTKKKTKNSAKTITNSKQKVQEKTKVVTTIKTKTKKNSKIKTTNTKVVTTVTTTTTMLPQKQYSKPIAADQEKTANTKTEPAAKAGTYSVRSVAAAADPRVLNAFEKIGCKVVVNPSVAYSGCFDARSRTITLKKLDATVYHELGHFVEFVGGTSAVKQSIAEAYSAEKGKYTAANKAYVLQSSSEYFAESFKNYCENPVLLKQSRPRTYEAVVQALEATTDARVNTLMGVYKSVWK